MSLDIVLVSNSSMNLYPSNKLSDFSVRLPHPLTFDSSYRVAVTRVSFTKSYFNFNLNSGNGAYMYIIHTETGEKYVHDAKAQPQGAVYSCQIAAGHYSPEDFIAMINNQIERFIKIGGTDKHKTFCKYKLVNGFLECTPGIMENKEGLDVKWEMGFDKNVKQILGISTEDRRPVFLNSGLTDLLLYCDLCYPSIVGDRNCDLLAILDGQTEKPYGSHCTEIFEEPWFHRLAKTTFQTIRIYIRTDSGASPPFKFGRVNLRLTFRKGDAI